MRALVVSVWVFINLVFFGMCGYMYLLWSQYWLYLERQTDTTTSTYDQQIFYYNRGYLPNEHITHNINNNQNGSEKLRTKHSIKANVTVTLIKNSRPRFPNIQGNEFDLDSIKYVCFLNDSADECNRKTAKFKERLLKELRRVHEDGSNVLKNGLENRYNVNYDGARGNFLDKLPQQLLCELKKCRLRVLRRSDVQSKQVLRDYLPRKSLFENKSFNSCAIVASAGALKNSNLGNIIDSHDVVLRFNHAPTDGFARDVGAKTTVRVVNSQVVTKEQFDFLHSNLYRNLTIIAWDPSNYTSSLSEWLEKPEFNLFPNYIAYRKKRAKSKFYIVNPQSLWTVWDFLQSNSPTRLRRNPPSSGFLGLGLLLPFCNFVDLFEYVPSTRVTKRCHYYDLEDNPACTFGVWHPLAAEKLLTYHLNTLDDKYVFQNGYVRVTGFRNLNC